MPISFKKLNSKKTVDSKLKSSKLSGVICLTKKTAQLLWHNRKVFLCLAIVYVLAVVLMLNVMSESSYSSIKIALDNNLNSISGIFGKVFIAGTLSLSALSGGLSTSSSDSGGATQLYSFIITIITWLCIVWMLRNILAKRKFKLRDALYNCCAPLIPTLLVGIIFMLELIPIVISVIIYTSAVETSFIYQIAGAIFVSAVCLALIALSIYWMIGTLFSLAVVALPGMYPIKAIKTGSSIVSGRRVQLIGRIAWLAFTVVIAWLIILIPLILLDSAVKNAWSTIAWLPFIPFVAVVLSAITAIWVSTYIYLLYREAVDGKSSSKN